MKRRSSSLVNNRAECLRCKQWRTHDEFRVDTDFHWRGCIYIYCRRCETNQRKKYKRSLSPDKTCATCHKQLGNYNKSGYCLEHYNDHRFPMRNFGT